MVISTIIVIRIILAMLIIHLACSAWILFLAGTVGEPLDSFDYLLIFTIAPEIILLFIICKLFNIRGGNR